MTANEPALSQLGSFEWDMDVTVRYEVALDLIGRAAAGYTEQIAAAESQPEPSPKEISQLREARSQCVADQRTLRVTDPDAIDEVIRRYSALLNDRPTGDSR